MDAKELATNIENAWMTYNAAVVSRLHPKVEKERLANLLINNINDIIPALRAYAPETVTVITDEKGDTPKKVKANGERKIRAEK